METIKYHTKKGVFNGLLVKVTAKKLHLVLMSVPIRVKVVPISENKYISNTDKSVPAAKRQLREAARVWHNNLSTACKMYLTQQ